MSLNKYIENNYPGLKLDTRQKAMINYYEIYKKIPAFKQDKKLAMIMIIIKDFENEFKKT